ncbi:hypothetical protein ASPZODRAFT_14633 [Penicilliopsis zonata CBS 506.65]|uniref:Uncharacterized protein n=1 Tax=Penicilliopsis zonata CBS 506.65 TaxID=1073090 RepID=A0A1L9SMS4_9EURO|nr:hypothetical protein ASPZODRAFT_14633 [Penicilliopsis zonata CBS 506.65]OJJ48498.1 hypothetical protein ASPZODRAFT_14633 [Penicilliopsis zonata CBS 506.65]
MDCRSDREPAQLNGIQLPSTLPSTLPSARPRRWSRFTSSSFASPAREPAVSAHPGPRHLDSAGLDEPALAHRTTALYQLNRSSKPFSSRKSRPAQATSRSSSTLASQPVLVRAYSGHAQDRPEPARMPSRRSFLLSRAPAARPRGPELPSDEDFSIEGILRAIEPDIRGTLDSIAEICGRSKLSLANEYSSHIAPLGEIRAPPGGLLTVDEATPSHEGQTDESVAILDDDASLADGRDASYPFSYYSYPHNPSFQPLAAFSAGDGSSVQVQPDTPRSGPFMDLGLEMEPDHLQALPATREFSSRPKSSGRALLATQVESLGQAVLQSITTPAIVSEMHLDAQADGYSLSAGSRPLPSNHETRVDLQGFVKWFRVATQYPAAETASSQQSAETRLRAMLEQVDAGVAHTA